MTEQDRLARLWQDASAFYVVTDDSGNPVMDEEVKRPKLQNYVMAREMSAFAMKNDLNEGQLIQPSNVVYWWRQGRVTRRVARMFELFIEHKKSQAQKETASTEVVG